MKIRVDLIALVFIICIIFPVNAYGDQNAFIVSQGGGWSDDFNDGNIDGWTVQGWDDNFTDTSGNFTADDHTLRAYDEDTSQAYHTSNVSYGTWTFDLHCVDTSIHHFYLAFISGSALTIGVNESVPYEYGLMSITGTYGGLTSAFVLYRRDAGDFGIDPLAVYDAPVVNGWYHIVITRDLSGAFEVFFNGTSRITAVDNQYTTSEIFSFYTHEGPAIDNIVIAPTPSTPGNGDGEPLDLTFIMIIGGAVAVVVIIVAVVIKSRS
ncbi:MAG: hypothetical protein ACFFBJ_12740 [Promethearchaeota archaeon]